MKKTLWQAGIEFEEAFDEFSLRLAYFLRIDQLFDFLTEKLHQLNCWVNEHTR